MQKSSLKIMLFGISLILLGNIFANTKTGYFAVIDMALGLFGVLVVMSAFFTKD